MGAAVAVKVSSMASVSALNDIIEESSSVWLVTVFNVVTKVTVGSLSTSKVVVFRPALMISRTRVEYPSDVELLREFCDVADGVVVEEVVVVVVPLPMLTYLKGFACKYRIIPKYLLSMLYLGSRRISVFQRGLRGL
jgi:hypothetical protein